MSITVVFLLVFVAVGVGYTVVLNVFVRGSKQIHILNEDEFEKQLAATKDALIIDVRTPQISHCRRNKH